MDDDDFVPIVMIRRNPATARQVEQILGLPDSRWAGLEIAFGNNGVAIASVDLLITGEQLAALAALAATPPDTVPGERNDPESYPRLCQTCGGTGRVASPLGIDGPTVTCPYCAGDGER